MTKNGKLILEIVHGSSEHPTAEQIFMKAREKSPGIALATVYNNLNSLVSEKLIRRIRLKGSPDRYDRTARHDHMICERCGKITDVHLDDLGEELERETGVKVISYDLNIHYLCDECRKNVQH